LTTDHANSTAMEMPTVTFTVSSGSPYNEHNIHACTGIVQSHWHAHTNSAGKDADKQINAS
jgi:hypothetical protein